MRVNLRKFLSIFLFSVTAALGVSGTDTPREQAIKIVARIQRADYENDRAALRRLHGELTPFIENKDIAARVRYWRGFALWRRAINGFNDSVDPKELGEDLRHALEEFDEASKLARGFVDARIGALSCVTLLAFSVNQDDPVAQQELILRGRQLLKEAQATGPENPRLLWVLGPNLWYSPPEHGGGQEKAMELYQKGLKTIRENRTIANDPLEPSWGEPELLMNLAWSNLNRSMPDLKAAEQYARSALELVPNWHYVRDILEPQIQEAQKKQN